jgi:tetratricopeptide (TPR) repeat protein
MATRIKIPAGSSLRQIAAKLGVEPASLQVHTQIKNLDELWDTPQDIEVPDGIFQDRDRQRRSQYAAVPHTEVLKGINAKVALNIEHRKTQVAGGIQAKSMSTDEKAALDEAWRVYGRLEADSNDLAQELFRPLTRSQAVDTRTEAYAGQSIALSQGVHLFGGPKAKGAQAALSAAKGAIMAGPQNPWAQLAFAKALQIEPSADNHRLAKESLQRILRHDDTAAECWAEFGHLLRHEKKWTHAQEAFEIAVGYKPECVAGLEGIAFTSLETKDFTKCETSLEAIMVHVPGYANVYLWMAKLRVAQGEMDASQKCHKRALELAQNAVHRNYLDNLG